jgi:ABC-2 type transport system ATP-binding protein
MIQVDKLSKHFDNNLGIHKLTFQVKPGEAFGILGPKGSGKTTTLRMLTAYLRPSSGTATVAGFDVFSQSLQVRQRVGYLPETPSFYSDMTVSGYLNFVAKLRKLDRRDQRVGETLELCGLVKEDKMLIGKLSKGMRQRLGLAQAVIHKPDVVILDEPTSGLEPTEIVELLELVKRLRQSQTLILSSQALNEIEQICDRLLILDKGTVVADGTPDRLLARLEGGHTVRLRTVSAPPEAARALESLDGVNRVSIAEAGCFDIECSCGADCRSALADLAVQNGWGLLELQSVDLSLDDVFLDLVAMPKVAV